MQFSEKQRRRIYTYLAQVEDALIHEPPDARREILRELKRDIAGRLRERVDGNPADDDIESILSDLGSPETCAGRMVASAEQEGAAGASPRVWLGVCADLAKRFGLEPRYLRLGVLALGVFLTIIYALAQLVLAPFLLIAYLAAYFVIRLAKPVSERRPIDYWGLLNGAGLTLLLLMGLEALAQLLLLAVPAVYARLTASPLDLERTWRWLELRHLQLFTHAVLVVTPFAVLGRLPVPPGWDKTLTKTAQAFTALYALALAYGIALLLTGAIIEASQYVTGFGGVELLG
jgi:phage shock protein PspC (stress-responsive transcriptional regulator)